jgi:cyclohexa-1,5-dienecarbonyl-CoA hydratase
MADNGIRVDVENIPGAGPLQAAYITLARPPLNILDIPTLEELAAALDSLQDRKEVRALVFAGQGHRAFSAGMDVRDHTRERVAEMLAAVRRLFSALAYTDKITIAAVRGKCFGGGFELAASCDLVLAAGGAEFGLPEIHLACFPPVAAITFPRLMGEKKATELMLTGTRLSAVEAAAAGLVNHVVPPEYLDDRVRELLNDLFVNSAAALRVAKIAMRIASAPQFDRTLAALSQLYLDELGHSHDAEEGVRAFLEKRPARWLHC